MKSTPLCSLYLADTMNAAMTVGNQVLISHSAQHNIRHQGLTAKSKTKKSSTSENTLVKTFDRKQEQGFCHGIILTAQETQTIDKTYWICCKNLQDITTNHSTRKRLGFACCLSNFFCKILFLLCKTFSQVISDKSSNRDILSWSRQGIQ